MFLSEIKKPLMELPGLGKAAVKSLAERGVYHINQLLTYYPFRYEDRQTPVSLKEALVFGKIVNTVARVTDHEEFFWKGKMTLKIHINDGTEPAVLLCFNRNFLAGKLPVGSQIFLYGSFQHRYGETQSAAFEFEPFSKKPKEFGKILPVYHLSGSLNQKQLRKAVNTALKRYLDTLSQELPEPLLQSKNLLSKRDALRTIHFPDNPQIAEKARRTLIFEELFHLQMTIGRKSLKSRIIREHTLKPDLEILHDLKEKLPFQLTEDQNRCLEDIQQDMERGSVMNRLIQGEVGSGKTLVAFLGAALYMGNGHQVAMAAPTELLARQHYESSLKLFQNRGIEPVLLTGHTPDVEKREILELIKEGKTLFIMGTHALFSSNVEYKDLRLVILDEQHRFGVNQRMSFIDKGENPDTLLMTATPIPRTLALTTYGDLDISSIKTMPKGRLPIKTHLALQENEDKVFSFVKKELDKGRQIYYVYPLIEKSEKMDLRDAESMFERLSRQIYPGIPMALIHSRIPEEEKRAQMERFYRGDVRILVATSVVEVGVDVPNASVMVIEHAERFGLSSLHQLRGRIGRGKHQSYVFLVYSSGLTEDGKKRLKIMKENSDGFKIAEQDLILRGPGELSGIKQSGYMSFTIADLVRDHEILIEAREAVGTILEDDPGLLKHENSDLNRLLLTAPPFNEDLLATG